MSKYEIGLLLKEQLIIKDREQSLQGKNWLKHFPSSSTDPYYAYLELICLAHKTSDSKK